MVTVIAPNKRTTMSQHGRPGLTGPSESGWGTLYRLGGAAAWLVVALVPIGVLVYVLWPPPTTIVEWFTRYHTNPIVGLLNQDLLMMFDQAILIILFLALFVALRHSYPSLMAIALALGLVGTAVYFASNTAVNMLNLSNQYAAATSEAQRVGLIGAGQAMDLPGHRLRRRLCHARSGRPADRDRHGAKHGVQPDHGLGRNHLRSRRLGPGERGHDRTRLWLRLARPDAGLVRSRGSAALPACWGAGSAANDRRPSLRPGRLS